MARKAPKHTETAEPRWASLAAACEYAGDLSEHTMRDWIRRGILPAYRIGPRLLQVDLNDLDGLRRRVPAASTRRTA